MRPIFDKSDTPASNNGPPPPATSGESSADGKVPEAFNVIEPGHEKLARIRQAIESGHYDSEKLLEESLARMLQKLEENEKNSRKSEQ